MTNDQYFSNERLRQRLLYETLRVSEAFALAIRSVQVTNDQ
ncbi:MAG: hypothetical protein V7K71_17990 [Nostoc sp.]